MGCQPLVPRAGSPRHIFVHRAASPGYRNVPRAASPRYKNVLGLPALGSKGLQIMVCKCKSGFNKTKYFVLRLYD